jgi:hypothetical protein
MSATTDANEKAQSSTGIQRTNSHNKNFIARSIKVLYIICTACPDEDRDGYLIIVVLNSIHEIATACLA